MNQEDGLMKLAKLALYADPRARDRQNIEKVFNSNNSSLIVMRCHCKNTDNTRKLIKCEICNCHSHFDCVDTSTASDGRWICNFCREMQSSHYLQSLGVNMSEFHQKVYALKTKMKYPYFIESADGVSNAGERTTKVSQWLNAISYRDDLYRNIHRTASSCMKRASSTEATIELEKERKLITDISAEIMNIANEIKNMKTPISDAIIEQILTHKEEKKNPQFTSPVIQEQKAEATEEEYEE